MYASALVLWRVYTQLGTGRLLSEFVELSKAKAIDRWRATSARNDEKNRDGKAGEKKKKVREETENDDDSSVGEKEGNLVRHMLAIQISCFNDTLEPFQSESTKIDAARYRISQAKSSLLLRTPKIPPSAIRICWKE